MRLTSSTAIDAAPVTIVLADDHAVVRSAVRSVLEAEGDFEVVAEAGDVGTAVRKVLAFKPNVLVLDLNMPGGSSVEAIPKFLEVSPRTAIVVLTMDDDLRSARAVMRAGALAFVLKEAADTELVDAARAAARRHRYLNPEIGARVAIDSEPTVTGPDGLTNREIEVLRLLTLGYTNTEIAHQLYLSPRTIEAHRAHIHHKIHRSSRAEMSAYARDHGLVD
jgi:two-component system, NarL family, response regulator NreC